MPRSLPGSWTGWSFTSTSPLSGWSSPAIRRSSVDFPHPEGPSSTRNSPMSRPSREYASSICRLMFSSASIRSPFGEAKHLETFLTVIFDLLGSMLGRLQVHAGTGNGGCSSRKRRRSLAPWEQPSFQECKKEPKQESSDADG